MIAFLLLATTVVASEPRVFENPKFCSPNGELCLIVRDDPRLGDFERLTSHPGEQRDPIDEWLEQYPKAGTEPEAKAEPLRGVLYRRWPSGNHERLAELTFRDDESTDHALVTNEGFIATYESVGCRADAELLTIREQDGSVVRTLSVRDVFTPRDQQWLCRGNPDDVRWSVEEARLRATVLITDGLWDAPDAMHETLDIDPVTGAVPRPERDRCPAALVVAVEPVHGNYASFDEDVVSIASQTLLDRAVERVIPEYPDIAAKARIAGNVRVDVLVGRDGRVESARVQPLPFGIDAAVKAAIARWTFQAAATRVSGSFVFRFELVRSPRLEPRTVVCTTGP